VSHREPQAPIVVAIDGPSGSGKSSVSKAVARALGVGYLDTGATYRAVTWWCLDQGVPLDDSDAVREAAATMPLTVGLTPDAELVEVAGQDLVAAIREPRVTTVVSVVATNLGVREILRGLQRSLIAEACRRYGGCVAEGRDITTVVAPDADVRVLLTASEAARLRRRAAELHGTVTAENLAATTDQIVRRDAQDATVSTFTEAAPGVTRVDTSDLDFDGSVSAVLSVVAAATGRLRRDD
jgi:cytidylate kinase